MSKWRVPQVMGESNRFGEIFVQAQCASNRATDGRHLNGVRQTGAQMVAGPIQKNLRLVLHSAKRARMNNACPISLKFRPKRMAGLRILPAPRVARLFRKRRKNSALASFHFFARFTDGREVYCLRCRRIRGVGAGSADHNECACWSKPPEKRSRRKVFPYIRKRRLSSKQQAGHTRRFFWNYRATDH